MFPICACGVMGMTFLDTCSSGIRAMLLSPAESSLKFLVLFFHLVAAQMTYRQPLDPHWVFRAALKRLDVWGTRAQMCIEMKAACRCHPQVINGCVRCPSATQMPASRISSPPVRRPKPCNGPSSLSFQWVTAATPSATSELNCSPMNIFPSPNPTSSSSS